MEENNTEDTHHFFESLLEKDLERMIFENRDIIQERGFPEFYRNTKRQYRLPSGGIMDIFTWEIQGNTLKFKIIELKKGRLQIQHIWQVCGYYREIIGRTQYPFSEVKGEAILVGNQINWEVADLIGLGIKLKVYNFKYDYNGVIFERWESLREWESNKDYLEVVNEEFCAKLEEGEDFSHYLSMPDEDMGTGALDNTKENPPNL